MIYIVELDDDNLVTKILFSGSKESTIKLLLSLGDKISINSMREVDETWMNTLMDKDGYYFFFEEKLHTAINPYNNGVSDRLRNSLLENYRNYKLELLGV